MNIPSFLAAAATTIGIAAGAATSTPVAAPHCVNITRYLAYGSSGTEVVQLQKFLGVKMTAYFGYSTQRALTEWQKSAGLIRSAQSGGAGATGPRTRAALRCKDALIPTTPVRVALPTVTRGATSATTTMNLPSASVSVQVSLVPAGGGGGGGISAPAAPPCPAFTMPRPPAAQCTTSSWQITEDEAGCPVQWDCSDPNATE